MWGDKKWREPRESPTSVASNVVVPMVCSMRSTRSCACAHEKAASGVACASHLEIKLQEPRRQQTEVGLDVERLALLGLERVYVALQMLVEARNAREIANVTR